MYGCGPVLLPIFLAVFLYCPLSLSFAHCLPTFSSTSGKVLSADIQRCRWMLYVSGELSLVGCYLRLHPCLEELTPTHPLQLMVTRVLMALGTENVDGFEGPHWSAAQATWFWSVRSEIQWPSSPSKSSFKSFSGFTCTLNIFFLLDWDPTPHLFSYLLLMLPFGCAVQPFSQHLERKSPFDISVSVHFTLEDVHQPLHVWASSPVI